MDKKIITKIELKAAMVSLCLEVGDKYFVTQSIDEGNNKITVLHVGNFQDRDSAIYAIKCIENVLRGLKIVAAA